MELTLFFHALAMLCCLGSVVLATFAVRPQGVVAMAIGFVAGSLVVRQAGLADPVWVGAALAALAWTALVRPRNAALFAASAGVLAGIWMSMLDVTGLPFPAGALLAALPPACAAWLSRRDAAFAPPVLRDEALLLVLVLAVLVAVAPGIATGWQSALALNLQQKEAMALAVPGWTIMLTVGATAAGGLYSVWMRR